MTSITGEYVNSQYGNFQTLTVGNNATVQGNLNVGGSIASAGAIEVPNLTGSTPGLTFSSDATTGFNREGAGTVSFFSSGNEVFRMGGSDVQAFQPITTGSNPINCGSLTSAGLVTQPQYALTNMALGYTTNVQANLLNLIPYPIASDVLTNWPTRANSGYFTVPVAGMYDVRASLTIINATGDNLFKCFWTKNDASPAGSTSIFYGLTGTFTPNYTFDLCYISSPLIQCNSGDELRFWCYSSGNFTTGSLTDNSSVNSVYINWLHP